MENSKPQFDFNKLLDRRDISVGPKDNIEYTTTDYPVMTGQDTGFYPSLHSNFIRVQELDDLLYKMLLGFKPSYGSALVTTIWTQWTTDSKTYLSCERTVPRNSYIFKQDIEEWEAYVEQIHELSSHKHIKLPGRQYDFNTEEYEYILLSFQEYKNKNTCNLKLNKLNL